MHLGDADYDDFDHDDDENNVHDTEAGDDDDDPYQLVIIKSFQYNHKACTQNSFKQSTVTARQLSHFESNMLIRLNKRRGIVGICI